MRIAWRVIRLQLAITAALALIWLVTVGGRAALAATAGGGISAALSLYVAVRVFAHDAKANPQAALGALYRAEAVKLLLAVVLTSLAILGFREHPIPVISTLAATLSAYWLALLGDRD
ncbi:ATP synthase subunit I [Arhodomonas sp. SL1]|uniref:ATP synthase subunit I n=1 Tax=Arhodomonas sp. SL1 TaxID=3425691 RepID=UPI003F8828EC